MIATGIDSGTVYPKKYAHGFCFAMLCCGYTLTDFPIPIRLTSLALWQSNDCPSASKATLMNMDKYFMWIHYERLYNHNKAKHNKTVCIFLGIYCSDSRKRYGWYKPWYQHLVKSTKITSWHFFISVTDGHWLHFRPYVLSTKGLWAHNWNFEICCPSNLHCDTVMLQFCTCKDSWRVRNCDLIGW